MAEAEPVQPFADRSAMHRHTMHCGHFCHDPIQRQVALGSQPLAQPRGERGQLALRMVTLNFREQATALAFQNDHVVHKARRHPKVPGRLTMTVPLLDKGDDPAAKFHRMCLAHSNPLYLARSENHKILNLGILNQTNRDNLVL